MPGDRSRIRKLRAVAASVCGVAYTMGVLAVLTALAGAVLGRLDVPGIDWLAFFVLEMCLGVAGLWLYPYERPRRRSFSVSV